MCLIYTIDITSFFKTFTFLIDRDWTETLKTEKVIKKVIKTYFFSEVKVGSFSTLLSLCASVVSVEGLRDYTVRGQSNVWRLPKY